MLAEVGGIRRAVGFRDPEARLSCVVGIGSQLAQRLTETLGDAPTMVDEVHGFRSFDERDLLGFVDGTENPEGEEASAAAFVGDAEPAFSGGSYVLVQKDLHDLAGWDGLPVDAQEQVIGRTKLSNIELGDHVKPVDIMRFSTAMTGSLFFAPAVDLARGSDTPARHRPPSPNQRRSQTTALWDRQPPRRRRPVTPYTGG